MTETAEVYLGGEVNDAVVMVPAYVNAGKEAANFEFGVKFKWTGVYCTAERDNTPRLQSNITSVMDVGKPSLR